MCIRDRGYSSSYLSHLFKEKTGMTLQSYLARKKIERGVELMKSGCYSWTQIALEPVSYTHLDVYKRQVQPHVPCRKQSIR